MLVERALQALHENHLNTHIEDAGCGSTFRASRIPQGIQLYRQHPDSFEGHRGLSGIPPASATHFCRLRKGYRQHRDERYTVSFGRPRCGRILCQDSSRLLQEFLYYGATIPSPPHDTNCKGVRQGDTVSPKLFTAALQWIVKSPDWEEKGIRVERRWTIPLQPSFCRRQLSLSRSPLKLRRC